MKRFLTLILCLAIVAGGIGGYIYLVKTKPKAEKKRPPRMTPMVQCVEMNKGDQELRLDVMGTVIAARRVDLKARVTGEIVRVHENWIEGGRFSEGDEILKLEDADYTIALEQALSDREQAEAELALEMGRQDIAKGEWALLGAEEADEDTALALRVPQLKSAMARLSAATTRVDRAELDLERTTIKAPFNALVIERMAEKGHQANPQTVLGSIVDTDTYRVLASIPANHLKWVKRPAENEPGSSATVRMQDGSTREGRVVRLLGSLEREGRMARLLVEIPDPLSGDSPVLLGSYVNVEIEGTAIADAYSINREHYREGGEIWLINSEKKLRILPVEIIWGNREKVVLKAEIADDEKLITSDVEAAVNNMELRLVGDNPPKKEPEGKPGSEDKAGPEGREKTSD